MTTTITDIEPLVRDYKAQRDILTERVTRVQDEQTAIIRRLGPGIKSAAEKTRDAKARLEAAIEQNPLLFEKPRTQTIEGIKVGFRKGKGKLIISEKAVELIKKHFPQMAENLIETIEKPNKSAIATLPAPVLRKIGCNVLDADDQVVISVPADDLDKLVDAMLQDVEV